MWMILLSLACGSQSSPGGGGVDEDEGLVLLEEDCVSGGSGAIGTVEVETTAMPTVLRVRWLATRDAETWVEYASADDEILRTPRQRGEGPQEALLLGLPEDADVAFRVVEDDGDTVWCGDPERAHTAPYPGPPPPLVVTGPGGDLAAPGFLIAPVLTEQATYVSILNRAGHYVWSWGLPIAPAQDGGVQAPALRTHLSRDGRSLLFNLPALSEDTDAFIYRVGLDGESVQRIPVTGGHVDFTELPDGTILMLGWETRTYGERTLVGDTIIAIPKNRHQEVVWRAFDTFDVLLSATYEKGYYAPDPEAEFWSHINSIRYDDDLDALVLTMTLGDSAFVLDASTFEVEWMLSRTGGTFSTVHADYPGPLLSHPHSAAILDDHVLVFSRGDPEDTSICAEAAEIALDEQLGTAEKVWRWSPDECMIVPFLGNAERLGNDNTLVNFASLGQIDEVNPAGDIILQLNTDLGAAFGYVDFLPSLYRERDD